MIPFTKGASHEANSAVAAYDQVQNVEKLTQSLTTLIRMYDAFYKSLGFICQHEKQKLQEHLDPEMMARLESLTPSPNEAEMHSYHLLVSLVDPSKIPEMVANLPPHVFRAPITQTAIQAFLCLTQENWIGWFRLVRRRATFLQACLMHPLFEKIRSDAIARYAQGFHVCL